MDRILVGNTNNGFYPEFSHLPAGAGWISVGPGYRHWLFGDGAIVEGSTAISWRMYKMMQTRFELTNLARSRLSVGSQVMWRDLTQVTYFGVGPDAPESDRSEYRVKSTDVVGFAAVRPRQWLSIDARGGWLKRPTLLPPSGSFKRGNPDTQTVFADDVVFAQPYQPNYAHAEGSVTADTRDVPSVATRGALYRAAASAYVDQSGGLFSFRRYEAEAAQFVPLADRRLVLAAHALFVGTETATDETVPFYLMPSLGGNNTLRGYTEYRFHDRNLLVVTVEARVALLTHIDIAPFVDAGNVASRVSGLNLDKTSYGIGLRLHSNRATLGRVDVAYGAEGWRLLLRTHDPLRLSRISRKTAPLPFAP